MACPPGMGHIVGAITDLNLVNDAIEGTRQLGLQVILVKHDALGKAEPFLGRSHFYWVTLCELKPETFWHAQFGRDPRRLSTKQSRTFRNRLLPCRSLARLLGP